MINLIIQTYDLKLNLPTFSYSERSLCRLSVSNLIKPVRNRERRTQYSLIIWRPVLNLQYFIVKVAIVNKFLPVLENPFVLKKLNHGVLSYFYLV